MNTTLQTKAQEIAQLKEMIATLKADGAANMAAQFEARLKKLLKA